jgi:60 kDa SS-A/Ro ribonucleoprotein
MKTNKAAIGKSVKTHEGAPAVQISDLKELRRSVMTALLWEDTFYESGKAHAARVAELVGKLPIEDVGKLAREARNQMYLRHVPLFMARELARRKGAGTVVADILEEVIQRPDELCEYLSMYWAGKDKDTPLSAGSKKGLARAFQKFEGSYALGKYKQADKAVKLRDVLRIVHPKPVSQLQATNFKALLDGTLETPDTWETQLSAGKDKKETFERLLREEKLGGLAFLRNLRNMLQAGVDKNLIKARFEGNFAKVLPFRFISAFKYAPEFIDQIEAAMFKAMIGTEMLPGKTILVVDVSGSMSTQISGKSEMTRSECAAALAIMLREICEEVGVVAFGTYSQPVNPYRGFALVDAIKRANVGHGTNIGDVVNQCNKVPHDRLIVLTDEQSHDAVAQPKAKRAYMLNVASYQNGVGYGKNWVNISGWSENVVKFIQAHEAEND